MADTDARILEMVRKELEKDRSVATEDLFEKAKKIDPGVARMTPRQFHAKYPLQIKRRMKGGRRGAKKAAAGRKQSARKRATRGTAAAPAARKAGRRAAGKRATTGARRGRRRTSSAPRTAPAPAAGQNDVRGLLLQFARQVAQASDKAEMVDVLAGIDTWVDRMVAAAGGR